MRHFLGHSKRNTTQIAASLGCALSLAACKPDATPQKKSASATTAPSYYPTSSAYPDSSLTQQTLTIRLAGQSYPSSTLQVTLNQAANWQFEAVGSDGYTRGQISRILVNGQTTNPNMTITPSTGSVIFTPRSQNDLIGTLEVYALPANSTTATEQRATFAWNSATTVNIGGGNGISSALSSILMKAGISVLSGKIDLQNLDASTIAELLKNGGLSDLLNNNTTP